MIMIEKLNKIAKKTKLSIKDMALIDELCVDHNIDFPITDCPDRYKEQVIVLLNYFSSSELLEEKQKGLTHELRDTVDIIWRGVRVNRHTITPEIEQALIEAGLTGLFKQTTQP
jgi:hypothetical protein